MPAAIETEPATRPAAGTPGGSYLQAQFERAKERERLKKRAALPLFVVAGVLGMSITFFALQSFGVPIASIGALIVGFGTVVLVSRLSIDSLIWARGIEGEKKAATYLTPLESEGFIVLNNRRQPAARGDIDHIVVGPTGIFVIETKNWSKKIEVTGDRLWAGDSERTWAIQQVYREALSVQVALADVLNRHRMTVAPVLCVIGGISRGQAVVTGVTVVDGKGLADVLRTRSRVFDDEQILQLAQLADERMRLSFAWEI